MAEENLDEFGEQLVTRQILTMSCDINKESKPTENHQSVPPPKIHAIQYIKPNVSYPKLILSLLHYEFKN